MNATQTVNQIRSWIDYIAGWILWLCWIGIVILAAGTILQQTGARLPFVTLRLPSMQPLTLCYLAGAIWLLKK